MNFQDFINESGSSSGGSSGGGGKGSGGWGGGGNASNYGGSSNVGFRNPHPRLHTFNAPPLAVGVDPAQQHHAMQDWEWKCFSYISDRYREGGYMPTYDGKNVVILANEMSRWHKDTLSMLEHKNIIGKPQRMQCSLFYIVNNNMIQTQSHNLPEIEEEEFLDTSVNPPARFKDANGKDILAPDGQPLMKYIVNGDKVNFKVVWDYWTNPNPQQWVRYDMPVELMVYPVFIQNASKEIMYLKQAQMGKQFVQNTLGQIWNQATQRSIPKANGTGFFGST